MTRAMGMILIIVSCLLLSITFTASGQEFGDITAADLSAVAPEVYPEANAIVLMDLGNYTITRTQLVIEHHKRIKILTEAGKSSIANISIHYHSEYDEIKNLKAHTITPDGVKHPVKSDGYHIKEYGKLREKTITFPAVEPGCIIEYSYKQLSQRIQYMEPWYFQSGLYTVRSSFTVNVYPGFIYNVSLLNIPIDFKEAKKSESWSDDGYSSGLVKVMTSSWELKELLPIKAEPYMTALSDYRSTLRFQLRSFKDAHTSIVYGKEWNETGAVYKKWVMDPYLNSGRKIKKLAKEITKGAKTDLEKSKAIYEYIVSEYKTTYEYNSRYFFHEEMSGLLEHKSGTPGGKNLLFTQMLQAVGLDSWPVLISKRSHGKFLLNNPDLQQVNYLIAVIQMDDSYYYIDCSSELVPYGMLPPSSCNEYGLLIDGKKSKVIRLPEIVEPSYRIDHTRMYVGSGSSASCSTFSVSTGYYATDQAGKYERRGGEKFVESQFISMLGYDCDLGDYKCEQDSLGRFVTTLDFESDMLTRKIETSKLVMPICFDFKWNPFNSEKRFFPVDFEYPFVYQAVTHIFFSDSVVSYHLPEDLAYEIEGAKFTRQSMVSDSLVQVITKLSITNQLFQPYQYSQLRQFFDLVVQGSDDEVVAAMAAKKD